MTKPTTITKPTTLSKPTSVNKPTGSHLSATQKQNVQKLQSDLNNIKQGSLVT